MWQTQWLLTTLLALPGPIGGEEMEVIRLKIGREVVGRVAEFDEANGVRIEQAADQSLLDIGWDQMHPEDVRRIRGKNGYLPDEPEPLYVEATRFVLTTGMEMVGRIVESNAETVVIKDKDGPRTLRWASVRDRATVQVNALEVYDGEELYAERLYSSQLVTALDHYNLALFAESLFLWNRVKEHLDLAKGLDAAFKVDIIAAKLKRAELRLGAAAEARILTDANQYANSHRFAEALDVVEKFLDANPGSALAGEFQKDQKKFLRMRQKYRYEQVAVNFFALIERFANRLSMDTETTIQDARKQMDQEATRLVCESLGKRLEADPKEIQAIWESPDRILGSAHTFTYGAGTFTLGAEKALEGFEIEGDAKKKAAAAAAAGDKPTDDPSNLEDRIKKLIEERKKAQAEKEKQGPKAKKGNQATIYDVPPTPEEWWGGVSTAIERRAYLLAFWAERDPHVHKISVTPRTCVRCTGEGTLKVNSAQQGDVQQPCDRCKGLRVERVVKVN